MNREDLLERLRNQRRELAALGVKSMAIFGSVARGDARADSDVDVLVEFDGPATFDRYMHLKFFLEELLGRSVDLLTRNSIRPELAPYVQQEAVHVA